MQGNWKVIAKKNSGPENHELYELVEQNIGPIFIDFMFTKLIDHNTSLFNPNLEFSIFFEQI